jgi:hypothetical protein
MYVQDEDEGEGDDDDDDGDRERGNFALRNFYDTHSAGS